MQKKPEEVMKKSGNLMLKFCWSPCRDANIDQVDPLSSMRNLNYGFTTFRKTLNPSLALTIALTLTKTIILTLPLILTLTQTKDPLKKAPFVGNRVLISCEKSLCEKSYCEKSRYRAVPSGKNFSNRRRFAVASPLRIHISPSFRQCISKVIRSRFAASIRSRISL